MIFVNREKKNNEIHFICISFDRFKFCHDENADRLSTIQYALVLRKWSALQPSKEFRCFVRNNRIIGRCLLIRND
jgi:hypothetical protein